MRGIYSCSFDQQTIAAASGDYDLFDILPATQRPLEVVALSLGNKSEVGDAQDEMLAYSIVRGNTTASNGAATTARALDPGDPAATFTALSVGSTPATAGTAVTLLADTFNVRAGLNLVFPPEMRPMVRNAERLCVRLTTAVADDLTLSGTIFIREL